MVSIPRTQDLTSLCLRQGGEGLELASVLLPLPVSFSLSLSHLFLIKKKLIKNKYRLPGKKLPFPGIELPIDLANPSLSISVA